MTILLITFACALIAAFLVRRFHVPIRHRWRRRQARTMCAQLHGPDREQHAGLIYARLRAMDALAFEELLLEAFEQRGCRVIRNRRYSGDGGLDGQVTIASRLWLIQAKRYRDAIRPDHVRDFVRLCHRRCQPGLFIHTGRTGNGSREAVADIVDVEIVSGRKLVALLMGAPFMLDGVAIPATPGCSGAPVVGGR